MAFCIQLGVFSSQVFQESSQHKMWRRKHCNISTSLVYFEPKRSPLFLLVLVVVLTCYFLFFTLIAAPLHGMEKHCNVEIAAHVSRLSSSKHGTWVLSAYEYFLFHRVFLFLNMHIEHYILFVFPSKFHSDVML